MPLRGNKPSITRQRGNCVPYVFLTVPYVSQSVPILFSLLFLCGTRKPARMNKNRSLKSVAAAFLSLLVFGIAGARGGDADHPLMNGKLRVTTLSLEEIRYTGKPYSKALGAYVFNARAYDATTSRWTTQDPSGFPDGANNRVYCSSPLTNVDSVGLLVTAVYAINAKTLTIDGKVYDKCSSGDNKYDNRNKEKGPIPTGKYTIYSWGDGANRGTNQAFILDYNDNKPQNDMIDSGDAAGR